jgi:hypothetical protein
LIRVLFVSIPAKPYFTNDARLPLARSYARRSQVGTPDATRN